MSLAVQVEPGREFCTAPSSSAPSKKKLLVASVAITGASVMAVSPMASNAPALQSAQHAAAVAQQRAVELAAFENPLVVLNETFSKAFGHLSNRGREVSTTLGPNLSTLLGNAQLQRELATALFNPFTTIPAVLNNLGEHRQTLITGIQGSIAGNAAHNAKLPGVIQNSLTNLFRGQFTESFAYLNDWFIFGLGESGWPLYPSLEIPGEVARAIGAPAIGAVLDAMFVGDTTLAGYPHAILVPYVSAIFRFTDSLDEIRASIVAGDLASAVSHVVNLPAKVVGAFLNGYRPTIAPEWSVFPGLLSEGGTLDGFFVQYPKLFADALRNLNAPRSAQTAVPELSRVSSPAVAAEADTVTLSLDTGSGGGTPVQQVVAVGDADEDAADESVTEDTADESVTEDTATEDAADPAAETETEPAADATAGDEAGTEPDDKTDAETGAGSDTGADGKAADTAAKAEADDAADAKEEKKAAKAEQKAAKAQARAAAKAAKAAQRAAAKADRTSDGNTGGSGSGESDSGSGSSGSDSE